MTVNLTTMLVMTTIFIAVMDKLPSTAYIKMIDIWLIFGQLIPFARVVITTVMEQLRNGSDRLVNYHGTAMEQSPKNLVGASAMPTGKFLRVRKVFARIYKIVHKMKPKHQLKSE